MKTTSSPTPNSRCLDLGCGLGQGSWLISQKAKSVIGVDISGYAIDFARKNYGHVINLEFLCADLKEFNIEGRFDYIYSMHVLEHIGEMDLAAIVANLKRMCHADTNILINVPIEKSAIGIYGDWQNRRHGIPPNDPTHITAFSVGKFIRLFKTNGFRLTQVHRKLFPSKKIRFFMDRGIMPGILKNPFTVDALFCFKVRS